MAHTEGEATTRVVSLPVPFSEVHRLDLEARPITCGYCQGEGGTYCGNCGGSGGGPDRALYCGSCNGTGGGKQCPKCEGYRTVEPVCLELGINCGACGDWLSLPAQPRDVTAFLDEHGACT